MRFLLLGKFFVPDLCIFFHCLFYILIGVIRLIKWRLNKDLLFSLFPTRKINTKVPVKLTRKINSEKRKQPLLKRKIALNILDPALYQNNKKVKVVGDTMYFSMSPSQCWKWPVARSPNATKNQFGRPHLVRNMCMFGRLTLNLCMHSHNQVISVQTGCTSLQFIL